MAGLPDFSPPRTAPAWRSRRLVGNLPELTELGELAAGFGDIGAFALEIIGDRAAQAGVGDIMRGVGGVRQISARQLVFALCAGLDDFEPVMDGEINGLIVANLEMQEGMMLDRAPVAAEQRV